jgi:hypothetical protein
VAGPAWARPRLNPFQYLVPVDLDRAPADAAGEVAGTAVAPQPVEGLAARAADDITAMIAAAGLV